MSEQIELTRRFYTEVFGEGRTETIDELCAEGFVDHEEVPGLPPTREGLKLFVEGTRAAFPDLHVEVDDIFESGDKVVARARFQGTHRGEFLGIAPTGRRIDVPLIDIIRIENGRAAEHWGISDQMTLMQQLGAIPEGAPA
jgi:steroid delta-isomerase-like uncharacterized protein